MARPRLAAENAPVIVQIKVRLYRGPDDDLLEFFARIPERLRAGAVKRGLRTGGLSVAVDDLPSDDDIEASLDALLG